MKEKSKYWKYKTNKRKIILLADFFKECEQSSCYKLDRNNSMDDNKLL